MLRKVFPVAADARWHTCLCIHKKREEKKIIRVGSEQVSIILCLLALLIHSWLSEAAALAATWLHSAEWFCFPAGCEPQQLRTPMCSFSQIKISPLKHFSPSYTERQILHQPQLNPKQIMRRNNKTSNLGLRALNIFRCLFKLLLPSSDFRSFNHTTKPKWKRRHYFTVTAAQLCSTD